MSHEAILERLVRERASAVEPSTAQKLGAQRSHEWLRAQLQTGQFANRVLDHYLTGSYRRQTAISPLDDVDIVFVIDPRRFDATWWREATPDGVLQSFARAIRYRYEESRVQVQRRSVGLVMHHLQIDVVPAIPHPTKANHISVPDRELGTWIESAPKIHTDLALALNQRNALFKPTVKVLKAWNADLPSTARLKSFAIETMVARLFGVKVFDSRLYAVWGFWDFIAQWGNTSRERWPSVPGVDLGWGARVDDLAKTGSNLVAKTDSARRKKFALAAARSRDLALAAVAARSEQRAAELMMAALARE